MSDMVTHWAAYEDCRRLAQLDDKIEPVFREVIESKREVAGVRPRTPNLRQGAQRTCEFCAW